MAAAARAAPRPPAAGRCRCCPPAARAAAPAPARPPAPRTWQGSCGRWRPGVGSAQISCECVKSAPPRPFTLLSAARRCNVRGARRGARHVVAARWGARCRRCRRCDGSPSRGALRAPVARAPRWGRRVLGGCEGARCPAIEAFATLALLAVPATRSPRPGARRSSKRRRRRAAAAPRRRNSRSKQRASHGRVCRAPGAAPARSRPPTQPRRAQSDRAHQQAPAASPVRGALASVSKSPCGITARWRASFSSRAPAAHAAPLPHPSQCQQRPTAFARFVVVVTRQISQAGRCSCLPPTGAELGPLIWAPPCSAAPRGRNRAH